MPRVRKGRNVVGAEHAGVHPREGLCARCVYCGARIGGGVACSEHNDLPAIDPYEPRERHVRPTPDHLPRRDKQGGRHCSCGARFSNPRALTRHIKIMRKRAERAR